MARGVKRWALVAVGSCVAVALAYLPPRGMPGYVPRRTWMDRQQPQATAARLRARALGDQWRAAQALVRIMEDRARMDSALAALPDGATGPALLVTGDDPVPPGARRLLAATLDSVWRRLGLGQTKIAVGVVVQLTPLGSPAAPTEAFLLPDSTDRTTCIAFIPASPYWVQTILGKRPQGALSANSRLDAWLTGGLGPCAFYAAFGAPGKPVRRWLTQRRFDLALYPVWLAPNPADSNGGDDYRTWPWYRDWIYSQRFSAVACVAGRVGGCRDAVLAGAGGDWRDSVPRLATPDRSWWRRQHLIGASRYLSDVTREVGPERFVRFWNSPLPVDTALAAALREPVGEWTARWQRRVAPPLSLGAAAPLGASILALLLAAGAVASVALTAARRQVR